MKNLATMEGVLYDLMMTVIVAYFLGHPVCAAAGSCLCVEATSCICVEPSTRTGLKANITVLSADFPSATSRQETPEISVIHN